MGKQIFSGILINTKTFLTFKLHDGPFYLQKELQPQLSWPRVKSVEWLTAAKIPFDENATKAELAAFAKLHSRPIVMLAEDLVVSCQYTLRPVMIYFLVGTYTFLYSRNYWLIC